MAGLPWMISFLCAAGCHLSAASPVLHTSLVLQTGQNVSLTCNVTSRTGVTWYHLRADQLLPLLTISPSYLKGPDTSSYHTENSGHVTWSGALESGWINLEIMAVGEGDAGHYFCVGEDQGHVRVNSGIQLTVDGVDGESTEDRVGQPCWKVGICVLPSLLSICFLVLFGLYFYSALSSGKPAVCCCKVRWDARLRVTQEVPVLYSSVKHPGKPRPSGKKETRLGEELVIYSKVMNRSHDHR